MLMKEGICIDGERVKGKGFCGFQINKASCRNAKASGGNGQKVDLV